jgi:hypothetical protein
MDDEPKKTFLVRYRYEGAEWAIRLPARDFDDAKARLGRLAYASIDGEHVMTIHASLGPLAWLMTAIRNAAYALLPRH